MISVQGVEGLSVDFAKFAKAINISIDLVVTKVALGIFSDIVQGTPIDTGRAMNNWVISQGVERHKIMPGVRGNMGGRVTLSTGGSKSEIAAKKAREAQQLAATYEHGKPIFITNSLEYIIYLNEGSSKQAPANFVQDAVLRNARPIRDAGFT